MSINGFINVLKPPGMTSHDVISLLRRIYRTKKIGHAGTLDPAAAGVLPVAVGFATRLLEYITDTDKKYRAEVLLGIKTDTDDDTGTVLTQKDFIMPSKLILENTLADFRGEISQIPSQYSAIKINGNKACDLARKNIEVDIPPRQVVIHSISLLQYHPASFSIDVHCSKGTYIRSLCADIGQKLNIPATMGFLIRTAAGGFELSKACALEEIAENPSAALQGIDILLNYINGYNIDKTELDAFRQGKKITYTGEAPDETNLLIHNGDNFTGIGKVAENSKYILPHKVFNA